MRYTPIMIAHERQIKVFHSIVISFVKEIMSTDSCPGIKKAAD